MLQHALLPSVEDVATASAAACASFARGYSHTSSFSRLQFLTANSSETCEQTAVTQDEWLRSISGKGTSSEPIRQYLSRVYRLPSTDDASHVDASLLGFFLGDVPLPAQLSSIPVIWRQESSGARPCERLWAPWADAMLHPHRLACSNASRVCDLSDGIRGGPGHASPGWRCAWEHMLHAFDAVALRFPGFFVQHVGAASAVTSAANDHAWIEVMRIARLDDREDAVEPNETCTVGQVWFWAAPGSGVWLNVGRSLVVRGDAARPGCREAHAQGYDTIQMPAAMGGFSSELLDCRGAAQPDARSRWESACPPAHVRLLAGTPQPRYAPALPSSWNAEEECVCDASRDYLSCVL